MTTQLSGPRTPWDAIGSMINQNVSATLPGAVQQGYNRGLGYNALQQAEQEISQANGDPTKIAMAFSRMAIASPEAARALGPIAQTAMMQAKVGRAFPGQDQPQQPGMGNQQPSFSQSPTAPPQSQGGQMSQLGALAGNLPVEGKIGEPQSSPNTFATPGPFNIMTQHDIDSESQRYARAVNDPNAYASRQAQLVNQNQIAEQQRQSLEEMASKNGIPSDQLARFLNVGSKFDTRNPNQWLEKTKQEYKQVKNNFDQLEGAFIPGIGSALLGRSRPQALKRLEQPIKELMKYGIEDEIRGQLASNYLSKTEIEELMRPLTPYKEKAISKLRDGPFPAEKENPFDIFSLEPPQKKPMGSFEEATERNPKEMNRMRNDLSNFFYNNVDGDTSLLVLRDKIWNEKGYDWRQFPDAIKDAISKGLKLNSRQEAELTEISTQAPRQSLPDSMQTLNRVVEFFRGNK